MQKALTALNILRRERLGQSSGGNRAINPVKKGGAGGSR